MPGRLLELRVENFRSLRSVSIPLGPLTVLVGPNAVGKSNVLKVFQLLAAIIRTDLEPALDAHGGFDEVAFWGRGAAPKQFSIGLKATWTTNASTNAPDEYALTVGKSRTSGSREGSYRLTRTERFQFKRTKGRGRRVTISGTQARVVDTSAGTESESRIGIQRLSSGLSTLPRLAPSEGGTEIRKMAGNLSSFRVFDVDVAAARLPSRVYAIRHALGLSENADNLAGFLLWLSEQNEEAWERLVDDARTVLPQLVTIDFAQVGGASEQVAVYLRERGLRRPTPLADASYGTVRLLGLLALLYDPAPPALTCVEEIDHGLHPQALSLVVERLREASTLTQFIVATHSPALADRLRPEELVICERDEEGASIIPALSLEEVREIVAEAENLPLGELWFSGVLGGSLTGGEL
jgi:predicted ATPase